MGTCELGASNLEQTPQTRRSRGHTYSLLPPTNLGEAARNDLQFGSPAGQSARTFSIALVLSPLPKGKIDDFSRDPSQYGAISIGDLSLHQIFVGFPHHLPFIVGFLSFLPQGVVKMAFRVPFRSMATAARQSLKIGLIPADGIGHEVIPAAQVAIEALGSDIPKPEFYELLAGFELFKKTGVALPEETVE